MNYQERAWPKVTSEWPDIQRDEMDSCYYPGGPISGTTLRVSTKFDGQIWMEKYSISAEALRHLPNPGDSFDHDGELFADHIAVIFHQMERSIKVAIEKEISVKTQKMVEQILNK